MNSVKITFNENQIGEDAADMLRIANSQNHWTGTRDLGNGLHEVDVIDFDSLGCDDTLSIRVKSKISFTQRARRFGMTGLSNGQFAVDETGNPIVVDAFTGACVPTKEHIERVEEMYSTGLFDERRWSLRDASQSLFGKIRHHKISEADAIDSMAAEFWKFCDEGEWAPILPRGRDGGRKTIGNAPTKRINASITAEDSAYLKEIGGTLSNGIRVAIESHKGQIRND